MFGTKMPKELKVKRGGGSIRATDFLKKIFLARAVLIRLSKFTKTNHSSRNHEYHIFFTVKKAGLNE